MNSYVVKHIHSQRKKKHCTRNFLNKDKLNIRE